MRPILSLRLLLGITLLTTSLGSCASSSSSIELVVDLQTDLEPGEDFVGVGIELRVSDGADGTRLVDERSTLSLEPSYVRPRQVTAFADVDAGHYVLIARLVDADGDVTASRRLRRMVDRSTRLPVVIQSACAEVTCPGDGDPEEATECLDGTCVPPECTTGAEPSCPSGVDCTTSSDCEGAVECAEGVCEGGVCLSAPDDPRCAAGERCDVREGCVAAAECGEGETREVDCAMCGRQPQVCGPDGSWTDEGTCRDQGDCAPGAEQSETSPGCLGDGSRTRTCGNDCRWSSWSCDDGTIRLWVHLSGGTEWQHYGLDPASAFAPSAPIRAAFNVDSADEAYVLTDSTYHVLTATDTPTWVRSGALEDIFPEIGAASVLVAYSVPGRHGGTPGTESVTVTVEQAGATRAEQYDYVASTRSFTHGSTVSPCCDDRWEGMAPATAEIRTQWLDVDNVDGWPEPTSFCDVGSTAEVYIGAVANGDVYVQDAGNCFDFVQRSDFASFPPFARPGAPPGTSEMGATFWHQGLYVLRTAP